MSSSRPAWLCAQYNRLIKFHTEETRYDELWLESLKGREGLSQLFEFKLVLLSEDAQCPLKTMMGKPARVEIELADRSQRPLHGLITSFSLHDCDNGVARYEATLSPWLWMLSRRSDLRIFQEKTVRDVLGAVFAQYELISAYEFRLSKPLKKHSYLTQFNETDLEFVLRLLEADGLFFYFEHSLQRHTLIIVDSTDWLSALPEQPSIRFHSARVTETEDSITQWCAEREVAPGLFTTRGFDYKKPRVRMEVRLKTLNDQGDVTPYEHYRCDTQYSHVDCEEGDRWLRHRIEAREVQAKTFSGTSNCRAMRPGASFELREHFVHDRDPDEDRHFLLLSVEHEGSNAYLTGQESTYENHFTCIRNTIAYRPPLLTARPKIAGPLTATVVGPPGTEVFTDEMGRIQVRFHWQRVNDGEIPPDDQALQTTWLRVAMPSAGQGFGHQFLPRVGQEVLVHFLAGDIDRPLIGAAVYNGDHPTPEFSNEPGLPGNRALSGIRSREHEGRGYNELLFDDTPGALRTRLASTHRASELNLGKLATPRQQGRSEPRGEGAELRSDAAIAVRAAHGLLLSTYARERASGGQLDRDELLKLLGECADLFAALGQTAEARGAGALNLTGLDALKKSAEQWPTADSTASGDPLLALASAAGIVSATPAGQAHFAGTDHDTIAHDQLALTSGAAMRLQAGQGVSAFAQDGGISAIANRGQVLVQAQEDNVVVNAQHNVHVSATEGEVLISAPTIRLVADDGSYIRLGGGGVEIGTPGKAIVHAAKHDWLDGKSDSARVPSFTRDPADQRVGFHYPGHSDKAPRTAADQPFQLQTADGGVLAGIADALGHSSSVARESMQRLDATALRKPKAD
ncbi:Rhs element Vgr protein [Pseudomonas sp. M47T1]|uniref:type VI secretion system Vgr family protein n=1 Tax=Pseudomonas sp. M47T1 TaxID=1179778 RepID=UPI0002606F7A|nr:type VI secretion system Vgr family protein [Pseudomonas sp. M47T1]EIK95227.1 Rhs element Vgr protein [Pseudomonas sp. M47T1]